MLPFTFGFTIASLSSHNNIVPGLVCKRTFHPPETQQTTDD